MLVVVGLFTAALVVLGPLGTLQTLSPSRRVLYWLSCVSVSVPVCYCVGGVLLYLTRSRSLAGILPTLAAAVLFEGVLCTAIVTAFDHLYRPEYHYHTVGYHGAGVRWANTYLTVTTVKAVASFFVFHDVLQRTRAKAKTAGAKTAADCPTDDATDGAHASGGVDSGGIDSGRVERPVAMPALTPRQARFHDRLSRTVSRDVIYLQMDDHYVDVHTSDGACLILMRFKDAVADLGDLGMQVHRSYWVAYRHVEAVTQRDGRPLLRLTGDRHVPVSRPFLRAVSDALTERQTEHVA